MSDKNLQQIAGELNLEIDQVRATAALLADNATVPFIARYRKEVTGSLDEVALTAIRDRIEQLAQLDKRREAILKSLQDRELLSDELKARVLEAPTLRALEDIYLPFRPKRRTRATLAREKGLEPLAEQILTQDPQIEPAHAAAPFVDADKGVASAEEALAGARDIIAERISEDPRAREMIRALFERDALIQSKVVAGKESQAAKYKDYFEWSEAVSRAPSHRILAMRRGEREKVLTLKVTVDPSEALSLLASSFITGEGAASAQVRMAMEDGYKRLLGPSIESEIRHDLKDRADRQAIAVFAQNLRELFLSPPLGQKKVLAIDPGFRTGGKVACLDSQGKLLHHDVIYCTQSKQKRSEAERTIKALCEKYQIEAIAVGNGTAGRETEAFLRQIGLPDRIPVVTVNESGASIYSASKVAREELPDQDVTVRGAVSIGRRLMDPLAELVKITPKSIGVGQYQHDVDQKALKTSLDDVVVSCVNSVGVELNTASPQLLSYTSGLGPVLARNIVTHRDKHGAFRSREDLKSVERLGGKAFEQAAGFLRLRDGENPLDATAVHPESYPVVEAMARDLGCAVADLLAQEPLRQKIKLERYVTDRVGMPTLNDIMAELARPGRDPRAKFEVFQFADGVDKLTDLQKGMTLPGIVTNVTAFGVFVDIGVHQDGLVHISQLANRYVKDPAEVVKVNQKVQVRVLEVDIERKRIALSMRTPSERPERRSGDRRPATRSEKKPPKPRTRTHAGGAPAGGGWFAKLVEEAQKKAKDRGEKR